MRPVDAVDVLGDEEGASVAEEEGGGREEVSVRLLHLHFKRGHERYIPQL